MTDFFFITGHQRSRTAWAANLFNTDGVFCHHDASRQMTRIPHLEDVVNDPDIKAEIIGDSDNGLPIFPSALDWFYEDNPDLPILIIRRPLDEVRASLRKLHYGRVTEDMLEASIQLTETGLDEIVKGPNVAEVDFHDLDDLNVLADISLHLTGKVIELQRAAYLRYWNVQMHEPHYSAGFSAEFCAVVKSLIGGP